MARTGTQFAKLTGDYSSINVYATWQLLSQDKTTRKSKIRLREYLTYSSSGTYGSDYSTFKLNGTTVKSGSYSYSSKGDHLVGYKDITVEHNEDGTFPDTKLTAYAYSFHFTGKPSETVTLTSKDIPDIEVGATINNITENWYDENYGVPNGVLIDANLVDGYVTSLYATVNGTEYLLSDNITNAQIQVYFDEWVYDNNQEIEAQPIYANELSWQTLCELMPNSASIDITFTLKSTDGTNESTNSQTYTFAVSKASFNWQPYLKADDKTNELTGSDTTFIENFSKLTFDSNVFGSLNGATVNLFKYIQTKYAYDISDVLNPTIVVSSLTQNNTSESSFVYDDIGTADDKVLKVGYKATIVDSRGFETTCEEITIPSDEYPVVTYEQPKLISATVERPEQMAPYVDVSISGSFWKDNFGAIENELTLQYRYKLSTASDYIDWAILEPKINEDGTFSYNGTLGSETNPLIPSDASAVFEIRIIDSTTLESTIKDITVPKGKSMYDWGENYFSWNGELCINDEEVPCFKEESENEDGSRQVQLYDSQMNKVYPNLGIEGGFVKMTLPTNLDNISTSYNYFHPFNYSDNDVLVEGTKLTYEGKTVSYGDRTDSQVYGVTVGSGVEYIRVSYNIRVLNNHSSNLSYTTDIGLLRDGEVTVIGGTSDTLMPSARHTTTGEVTQIPVKEGDFLFIYAYKGSKTADIDVISSWDMTNATFEVTHVNGITVINSASGTGSGTDDYESLNNIPRINGTKVVGNKALSEFGIQATLEAGDNVEIVDNKISVLTTNEAIEDNTTPITSAGVYTQLGNISVLLETI